MKIGYARVSTGEQNLHVQTDRLRQHGCERIFEEIGSGSTRERADLTELFEYLREGDTLVVVKLDRLSRSLKDLLELVERIHETGAHLQSLSESIDTTSSAGKLTFHVFGMLAEFERERIRERTLEGLAAAKARGRSGGRPFALSVEQRREVAKMKRDGRGISELARLFKVSQQTIRRIPDDLGNDRGANVAP